MKARRAEARLAVLRICKDNRIRIRRRRFSFMGKSPIIRCPKCGAPHGGSQGKLCPDCAKKSK